MCIRRPESGGEDVISFMESATGDSGADELPGTRWAPDGGGEPFPLPYLPAPTLAKPGLSRGTRQRVTKRGSAVAAASEAIWALNHLSGVNPFRRL
jgi:hypothetical protein